jgi:hypothetical protein
MVSHSSEFGWKWGLCEMNICVHGEYAESIHEHMENTLEESMHIHMETPLRDSWRILLIRQET